MFQVCGLKEGRFANSNLPYKMLVVFIHSNGEKDMVGKQ